MRPIDADTLLKDLRDRVKKCDEWVEECAKWEVKTEVEARSVFITKSRAEATRAFITEMILTIQQAPTIEQPHGRWIYGEGLDFRVKCNYCGNLEILKARNFCPNCGKKMKGGDKK